jgi:hypothetical protein
VRKLAASAEWRAALADGAAMIQPIKRLHEHIAARDSNLLNNALKAEELLGPVLDTIHQPEADQPMLSFLSGVGQTTDTCYTVCRGQSRARRMHDPGRSALAQPAAHVHHSGSLQ